MKVSFLKDFKKAPLLGLSFLGFIIFLLGSFLSPSLRAVGIIIGIGFWLIALFFKEIKIDFKNLHYVEKALLGFILVATLLGFYHEHNFPVLKIFSSVLLVWLWIRTLIASDSMFISVAMKVLVFLVFFVATVILLQLVHLLPLTAGKYFGILKQPFTSSGLLLVTIFLLVDFWGQNQSKLFFWAILAGILSLTLLGQVSSILALLVGLIIYSLKTFKPKKILGIFLLASTLLTTLILVNPRLEKKLTRLTSMDKFIHNKSMQARIDLWEMNLEAFKASPILGLGKPFKSGTLTHMHNIYLQKLIEGGLVKFIAWFVFYMAFGIYLLKNFPSTLAFFCAYLALSIEGLLENWWGDSEVLGLFILLMALAVKKNKEGPLLKP